MPDINAKLRFLRASASYGYPRHTVFMRRQRHAQMTGQCLREAGVGSQGEQQHDAPSLSPVARPGGQLAPGAGRKRRDEGLQLLRRQVVNASRAGAPVAAKATAKLRRPARRRHGRTHADHIVTACRGSQHGERPLRLRTSPARC